MRIKFWGVRGSTPTPERRNSRYGGNTCCLEIRLANGTIIVLDCGSGLRALGKSLLHEFGEHPIHGYVFMTHFHWDHIQGIPFFGPLYRKGNVFLFHSVLRKGLELRAAVEGQMVNPYFPVDMSAMGAVRHFFDLDERPTLVHPCLPGELRGSDGRSEGWMLALLIVIAFILMRVRWHWANSLPDTSMNR